MAYTYDDFLKELNRTGATLSQADMELARKYPDAGISLLALGQDYNKATTQEQRVLAHEAAEELRRSYGGYSGGTDGSGYQVVSKPQKQTSDALDKIGSYGSFRYDAQAPTYTNPYAEQQKALLDQAMNQEPFSWRKEDDPLWSSYKKSYLREGERASADALAKAAAASGGRPSSFAVTAAGQAGDYYAAQLNDIIPTLEQQAYGRHQDEQSALLQRLNALNTQEQLNYAKYLDELGQYNTDRNFAMEEYLAGLDVLQAQQAAAQGQSDVEYSRYLDDLERADQQEQEAKELARGQVDAILAAGGNPGAALVAASGYSNEYVKALQAAMADTASVAAPSGGSGSGGRGGGSGSSRGSGGAGYDNGGLTAAQIMELQTELGVEADGFYGPETQAAAQGLTADEAWAQYAAYKNGNPVVETKNDGTAVDLSDINKGIMADIRSYMISLGSSDAATRARELLGRLESLAAIGRITPEQADRIAASFGY